MLAPFDNVSVYPMLAKLLGVAPEENDGDLRQVADAGDLRQVADALTR